MLKLFAILVCVLGVLALFGFGWAWVTMLIAEQHEFNEDQEAENDEKGF